MFKVYSQIDYRLPTYGTTLSQFCGFELFNENISWWCSKLLKLPFSRTQKKSVLFQRCSHTSLVAEEKKRTSLCALHWYCVPTSTAEESFMVTLLPLPLPMRTKTIALLLDNANSAVSVSDYVLEAKRLFNAAQFCGANIRARHCCLHARRSNYNT